MTVRGIAKRSRGPAADLRPNSTTHDKVVVADSRAAPAAREPWPPTRRSPRRLPQALTRPRHGQHRNVLVRKFVTSGTIEEKIELMLTEKRQLADELIDGDGEVGLTELPDDELLDLVRLDVTRAAP